MTIAKFKENLALAALPVELEKLIYFQNEISSYEEYSDGFGLMIDDKSGLKSWSDEKDFLNRLYPFAQANGSGSFYAIWDDGTGKQINEMPIVVFGDEGGVHVVAENMVQLLHLLSFDSEISVDFDTVYFYKSEEYYQESSDRDEFLKWLKGDYNLDPITEEGTEEIIKNAQAKYKTDFDKWIGQYCEL